MAYIRLKMIKLLQEMGFRNFHQALDSDQAVLIYKEYNPHFVILDDSFVENKNVNLIKIFHTLNKNIKAALCSAADKSINEKLIPEETVIEIFDKPIVPDLFKSRMEEVFKKLERTLSIDKDEIDEDINFLDKYDINLDLNKALIKINFINSLDKYDVENISNMIISLQMYTYFNVLINLGSTSEFTENFQDICVLKDMVEEEGWKFFIISTNPLYRKVLMETELKEVILENVVLAESQFQ